MIGDREQLEDAIELNLLKINGSAPWNKTVTSVVRRPKMQNAAGTVEIVPGILEKERVIAYGSGIWKKVLPVTLIAYYTDATAKGSERYGWLKDFERFVDMFQSLPDENGSSTADKIEPRNNFWSGAADNLPLIYLVFQMDVYYSQRMTP